MTSGHKPDRAALILAVGVHVLLALAFLMGKASPPPRAVVEPKLTLFDIALPRIPPVAKLPPGGSPSLAAPPPSRPDSAAQPMAPPQPLPPRVVSPFAMDDGSGLRTSIGSDDGDGAGEGLRSGISSGAGEGAPRYADADWIYKPTLAETMRFWPPRSVRERIAGHVKLACLVPRPGKPERCWVLTEAPLGVGFGRAALALSRLFRLKPARRNDEPLDLPVVVPVVFAISATAAPE